MAMNLSLAQRCDFAKISTTDYAHNAARDSPTLPCTLYKAVPGVAWVVRTPPRCTPPRCTSPHLTHPSDEQLLEQFRDGLGPQRAVQVLLRLLSLRESAEDVAAPGLRALWRLLLSHGACVRASDIAAPSRHFLPSSLGPARDGAGVARGSVCLWDVPHTLVTLTSNN